ncbi:hypothetical protein [Kitasatospora acidiphila]|uniref:hypothetical protein n=1 Tax=Kitasatospora acidiphila TaxID=2567942 RepID=UPI003C787DF1
MLAALLVAVALLAWLTLGQDGGKQKAAQPAPLSASPSAPGSITPGATPTGPAISSVPGGSGGGSTGGASSGATGAAGGSGGAGSGGSGSSPSATAGAGGSSTGGSSTGGSGAPPINTTDVMALPVCTASQLTLELAATPHSTYSLQEKPTFVLRIRAVSGPQCRVDLSQAASSITVSTKQDRIWSSADCVTDKQGRWVQAPTAGLTETFSWDRSRSKPQCATPGDTSPAPADTYLVQADVTGPAGGPVVARTSIQLVTGS